MTASDTATDQERRLPGQPAGWEVYARTRICDHAVTLVARAPCGSEVDLGEVSPFQSMLAAAIEVDWAAVAERVAPA